MSDLPDLREIVARLQARVAYLEAVVAELMAGRQNQ